MSTPPLPPTLAPWAPWLRMFDADLALSLGPLIQRLAAALGPFPTPASRGAGEPDGFGGLTRRGNYERLLVSEWLLAELMPDEFLRRAATSEHVFLDLARREPARARASVALIDVGPTQLGGPRIAHLAALIALARRADVVQASFAWGVLQAPDASLVTATTRDTLRALLRWRTAHSVTPEQWNAWRARIDAEAWQDVWIVGGPAPTTLRWPRSTRHLEIDEPIAEGPPALELVVRTHSGRARPIVLPLPDGPSCVRLIRDPFPQQQAAPTVAGTRTTGLIPDSELVISPMGDRVFARARGGGVIVYPVPHSARGGVGRPKLRFSNMRTPASAVAWHNRGAAALFAGEHGSAVIHQKPDRRATGDQSLKYAYVRAPFVPSPRLRPLLFRDGRTLVHDGADHLLGLVTSDKHTTRIDPIERQVLAAAEGPRWFAYVAGVSTDQDERTNWRLVIHQDSQPPRTVELGLSVPQAACFANHDQHGCLAAVVFAGRCQLYGMGEGFEWHTNGRVVGLLAEPRGDGMDRGPALITLGDDQRSFFAHHPTTTECLTVASEPVLHAVLSTVTGHLAYVTTAHTVVVLKPPYDAPLARFLVKPP